MTDRLKLSRDIGLGRRSPNRLQIDPAPQRVPDRQPHVLNPYSVQASLLSSLAVHPSVTLTPSSVHPCVQCPRHTRHLLELLTHPYRDIADDPQRQLPAKTHARPAVERQVSPARPQRRLVPALRLELVRVRAPDARVAVHRPDVVAHAGAARDEDGGLAVQAAAAGQDGVDPGDAVVHGDGREEAKGFGEAVLQVGEGG